MSLSIVVEGDTDLPVVRKLAADAGMAVATEIDASGKNHIDRYLTNYNDAARGSPWFVLRDLDDDAECAPTFLSRTALAPSTWMCFRIAVREIEAWLLADAEALSKFLAVDRRRFPADPDAERDPTLTLVNLARTSRRRDVRRRLVPPVGASAQVGPLYEATIIEFAEQHWDIKRAANRSDSLRRARAALTSLSKRWDRYVSRQR